MTKLTADTYKHLDNDNIFIILHDCFAEKIHIENGVVSFSFNDGFWIMPEHPCSTFSDIVRTDASKVDFYLEKEGSEETIVYIFKKTFFKNTIRKKLSLDKLAELVNNRDFTLEFLYQYKGYNRQLINCWLHFNRKPYYYECFLELPVSRAVYHWNNLLGDRKW